MKFFIQIVFVCFFSQISFGQASVEIPNVFTPNNDGVNDIFYVRSSGYNSLKCTIINRYGETVYQFFGLNGNWDGYSHAGMPCSDGTYFVVVEVTDESGNTDAFQGTLQLSR
ncbi:MAG: T9SS type B sorting domain-containing protein [Putridiphycobacter sp.]